MALQFLKAHGLNQSDVQIVELSYPNMLPALSSGAVDIVHGLEPFTSRILAAGVANKISDLTEVAPQDGYSLVPLVYSEKFDVDRETAQAFMTAYVKGVRVYNDAFAKNIDKDKVIDIIARYADLKPEVVRAAAPTGLDPNQTASVRTLEVLQDFFVEKGFLRKKIDVTKIVDPSFSEAAVAKLGAYK
jgi:NitT/TauT family transport system substrate-binding protein